MWCRQGAEADGHTSRWTSIKAYLTEVRTRLDRAAGIARAADACAGAGFCDKAVKITLDIELPLYEVTTLLNAVSLINRLSKET